MKVLSVSYPVKNNYKYEVVNKEVDDLQNSKLQWVVDALKTRKTPSGVTLEPCPWHSGTCHSPGDTENIHLCQIDPLPEYGIWLTNYEVLDTCHLVQKAQEKLKREQSEKISRLIDSYNTWFTSAVDVHLAFSSNISRWNKLKNDKRDIEKTFKALKDENFNNPEYIGLVNNMNKNKLCLLSTIENLKKTPINCDMETFINEHTTEEKEKYEKSLQLVNNWENSFNYKNQNMKNKLDTITSEYIKVTENVKSTYQTSFVYLHRCLNNLELISIHFSRNGSNRNYTQNQLDSDIAKINQYISEYSELADKPANEIIEQFDKMERRKNQEQRELRNNDPIRKIKQKKNIFVVSNDGTTKSQEIDEKIFINYIPIEKETSWR
jgi:hypothetical protein